MYGNNITAEAGFAGGFAEAGNLNYANGFEKCGGCGGCYGCGDGVVTFSNPSFYRYYRCEYLRGYEQGYDHAYKQAYGCGYKQGFEQGFEEGKKCHPRP